MARFFSQEKEKGREGKTEEREHEDCHNFDEEQPQQQQQEEEEKGKLSLYVFVFHLDRLSNEDNGSVEIRLSPPSRDLHGDSEPGPPPFSSDDSFIFFPDFFVFFRLTERMSFFSRGEEGFCQARLAGFLFLEAIGGIYSFDHIEARTHLRISAFSTRVFSACKSGFSCFFFLFPFLLFFHRLQRGFSRLFWGVLLEDLSS